MEALDTPRLTLEPLLASHADAMFAVLRDPELYRYLDYGPHPSIEHTRSVYARLVARRSLDGKEAWLNWIIVPRGGKAVGFVQATVLDDGRAFFAYLLAASAQGRGLATEAVVAMMSHLAAHHGVHTFLATVEAAHAASIALLERVGMRPAPDEEAASHDLGASERLYVG